MKLSIVDLSPVPKGESGTEAYEHTVERAQAAERLGYERYWVAEHHGVGKTQVGTAPEVLIAYLAAKTSDIRVGSGTVLLNHYSPYKVAETFGALDALAPGRIDLGLGRASGSPAADLALQHDRSERKQGEGYADKILEVAAHIHKGFPEDHPFAGLQLPRSEGDVPEIWVLGSSPSSASIAAQLGLPYCFAAFINPGAATQVFEVYRDRFEPSRFGAGPPEPRGMIGVNVSCAETDEEAARLRASVEVYYQRLFQGNIGRVPSAEEAVAELGGIPDLTPGTLRPEQWPRQISGSPSTVADLLEQMTEQTGVDEVVVQNLIADPGDVLRSHELIAEGVGLAPREAHSSQRAPTPAQP